MNGAALERVFRDASGRLIAALASRYRDLDLAEEAFAEAAARAASSWTRDSVPQNPSAWLFRVADRVALDMLRRNSRRRAHQPDEPDPEPTPEEILMAEHALVPDERLRLIFVCCHPALSRENRAVLTLRLVCGLSVEEIARAFLVTTDALAKRLGRAKHKIAAAKIPFETPPPSAWNERLDAVLATLEVAYAQAHQDASGSGVHAAHAAEVLNLTQLLAELIPADADVHAFAALVRYTEARRPARIDASGLMIPLSEQDPRRWRRELIEAADRHLTIARALDPGAARTLQAELQASWCRRPGLEQPPPWREVLDLYDRLLEVRDDPIVRINRAVAVAEMDGPAIALQSVAELDEERFSCFPPFQALRASLCARTGDVESARSAYNRLLSLGPGPSERRWIELQLARLGEQGSRQSERERGGLSP